MAAAIVTSNFGITAMPSSARTFAPSPPLLALTLAASLLAAPQAAEAEGLGREQLPHAIRRGAWSANGFGQGCFWAGRGLELANPEKLPSKLILTPRDTGAEPR